MRTRGGVGPGNKAGHTSKMEMIVYNIQWEEVDPVRELLDVVNQQVLDAFGEDRFRRLQRQKQIAVEMTREALLEKLGGEKDPKWEL